MKFKTFINKICTFFVRVFGYPFVLLIVKAKVKKYKPKTKNFIVIANHSDGLDPIYITCSLGRYIRFVAGDHTILNPWAKFFFKTLLLSIYKKIISIFLTNIPIIFLIRNKIINLFVTIYESTH